MEIERMDYDNTCRTCLSSAYQLEPIFDSYFKNIALNEILMLCAPISISPMDGLSDKICSLCKNKATSSYEFQLLCTNSDQIAKSNMMMEVTSVKLETNHLDCPENAYNDAYADFTEFEKVLVERVGPVLNSYFTNEVDFQPNICENCDQFFESAEILKQHSLECGSKPDIYQEVKPKDTRKHKCEVCEKLFETPSKLARHSTIHIRNNPELNSQTISTIVKTETQTYEPPKFPGKHRCEICGKMAQSPSKLLRHLNTHNKVKATSTKISQTPMPIQQAECVKMEVEAEQILEESCDNSFPPPKPPKEKRYKCDICGSRQESPSKLLRHMGTHNKQKSTVDPNDSNLPFVEFPCTECSQKFFKQSALDRHKVVHSLLMQQSKLNRDPHEMFCCVICSQQYKEYDNMLAHMRNEHKGNNEKQQEYTCVLCDKSFNTLFNIMRHAKTHEQNATHGCVKCGRKYGMGNDLIDHVLRHENYKPFSCQICDKSFLKQYKLKNHMMSHQEHGEKKIFLCPECGREFAEQYYLKRHLLRHSGVKKYACNLCPSKFTFQNGLTSHMSTHTGLKPHSCTVAMCNASFAKAKSLKSHQRLHTGVRPYGCEQCGKRFNESGHLTRHVRTHTGEKPYSCSYCSRSYAQSNDLVKHTRTHVGANYYKCQICSQAFRLQGELKLHIPIHFAQGAIEVVAPELIQQSDV